MDFATLVKKARTHRCFKNEKIALEDVKSFVEIASQCPSARNTQGTRYVIVHSEEKCRELDKCINLRGLNYEKRQEIPNMHPTAYIVLCATPNVPFFPTVDLGIIAQTIQLAAAEKNIATCIIGAFNKVKANKVLDTILEENNLEPYLILALGYPDEKVHLMPHDLEKAPYWREADEHYVQKNSPEFNTIALL